MDRTTPTDESTSARPVHGRRAVTAAMMLVMVLASMEQTITSTVMPTIIGKLQGLQHYAWVGSIYLLACAVSMPLYGRLADSLGRKRLIVAAIGIFAGASLGAATSRSMPQLIAWRGLQGLGAGGIMPLVLTILGDIFTLEERARIQGLFSAVWGAASLAGPALGAFLVQTLGWRSVFFVNLPLGLLGLAVLVKNYHDHEKPHPADLDLAGAITLTIACLATLLLAGQLSAGENWSMAIGCLALAVAATWYFLRHERRATHPILPLDLIADRNIGPALLGSALLGVGFLALDTFVPPYVQGDRGGGPAAAGWVVTPVMFTWALSGIGAAPLVVRWGFRKTALLGSLLIITGFTGLLVCTLTQAPRAALTAVLAITGLGFGPSSMSFLLAAQNAVQWNRRAIVTGSIQFFRTAGGAVGIGLLGGVFNLLALPKLRHLEMTGLNPATLLDPQARRGIPPDTLHTAVHMMRSGFLGVFIAMLGIAVLQFFVSWWMPAKKFDHHLAPIEAAEALMG